MNFVDAVRSACSAALRDDSCRIVITEWQIIYRRKESIGEFATMARALGYDARDEGGDGIITVYEYGDRFD